MTHKRLPVPFDGDKLADQAIDARPPTSRSTPASTACPRIAEAKAAVAGSKLPLPVLH
jgi:hypothetical protein